MLEKIGIKNSIEMPHQEESHHPSRMAARNLFQSSLEPVVQKPPNCCLEYLKSLFYAFLDVLYSFFDLLKTLLCCSEEEKVPFVEIEQMKSTSKEDTLYLALPLRVEDQQNIHFIFHNMAIPVRLVTHATKMYAAKANIRHVHPFRLVEYLFKTDLKQDVIKFRKNWLVWDVFMKEFAESFTKFTKEEEDPLKLSLGLAHALGFATDREIIYFIRERKWEELFDFLLKIKT